MVAPELECFLVEKNIDPDFPLKPPIGRSGRPETARQAYGIDAVNEFDPLFEDIYDYCEAQELDIDTLIHESGAAQMEINFLHGDPLDLADQAFLFKRTCGEAAYRHGIYATFMATPLLEHPLQSLRPRHRDVARGCGFVGGLCLTTASSGRHHLFTQPMVRCKHAVHDSGVSLW